jgi:carboxyl-terminal processing protease
MNTFVIQALLAVALALTGRSQETPPQRGQVPNPRELLPRHLLERVFGSEDNKAPENLSEEDAGRIAHATALILQRGHYRQAPLDDEISRTFFTNYLSTLDYARLVFTQQDVQEFASLYADRLDDLTKAGDASPGYVIFERYLARLEERNTYAQKLLASPIDFEADERFTPQRDKSEWPRDAEEAEELWRLRVKFDALQGRLADDDMEDVVSKLSKRYSRLLKTMKDYDREEILSVYLTALSHAYDPHSDYMSPSEAKQFEISNVKLSLTGIGALLEWDDGYTRIKNLVPGGPAERSKQLKPKDRIVAVAQGDEEPVDVVEMRLNKVVELIRGTKGTEVRLTIERPESDDETRRVVRLIRDDIPLAEQYAKARIVDVPSGRGAPRHLGIIVLPQFYENCARDVEKLIRRLKEEKVEGIVLDLRRNGGGILEEAVDVTGLFIRRGPVVQVKRPTGASVVMNDEDPRVAWDGPLAVAVGHLSASASEIVAAALQDYGRAIIVGDSATHGKGTVQQLVRLSDFFNWRAVGENAGKLKFTVSKFYRIAGGTTQKYGVTPDISLPSVLDYMELGESHLPNCLPADRTTPLEYGRLEFVEPFLATLRERSANRVAVSPEYAYILEDIEEIKKRKADPSFSLNEATRLAEKAERQTREDLRKKERHARAANAIPIMELTLEAVDKGQAPTLISAVERPAADPGTPIEVSSETDEAEEDEDSDSHLEPPVRETLNILVDYLNLLAAKGERLALGQQQASSRK